MIAGEFSGVGWAPGQVQGARSFKVDKIGRLTGVNYEQVWTPDENTAECRRRDDMFGLSSIQVSINRMLYVPYAYPDYSLGGRKKSRKPEPEPEPTPEPPHTLETCACGFYGYYDGSNDYHAKGMVSGVVQGYGETLIGTRGFRCMKARIVALRIPKSVDVRLASLVARNYPNIPLFTSFKDMVAEFPTDAAGMEVTPESDPDFWTRRI